VRILMRCESKFSAVQPQARFPPPRIRTMACITVFRQNWLDRVIKGELFGVFFWSRSRFCFAKLSSSEEAQTEPSPKQAWNASVEQRYQSSNALIQHHLLSPALCGLPSCGAPTILHLGSSHFRTSGFFNSHCSIAKSRYPLGK
jgi:hypothetical protein